MKQYEFNGELFDNLDLLAQAYIDNFESAMDDIYANSKLLLKFVRRVTKNKNFTKEIASILTYTKYKNNALTFIIYNFLDDKKVYINGKEFTLKEFIESLKLYPDKSNILIAFMEDYGISKTFANDDEDQKLAVDAFFIEKHFDDPFTIKYLNTYYDYQIIESLNARISTIAVNGEECFRRATKVAFNEDFQLGIAHKLGFRAAIDMHNDFNPIFKAIKLLKEKKETEEEYLKKIITDTFYWWLLDNLDKYEPLKKEAKPTFKRLRELKKENDKYQKMIAERKITDISLDLLADLSRSIYLNYLNFVTLFRNGKIRVKTKYSENTYSFDKPYCKTYITADFMKDHIVKLYNPSNKDERKVITVNPLTGREIEHDDINPEELDVDDISEDKPVLVKVENENIVNEIKYAKKILKRNKRFANYAIFTSIINSVIVIAVAIVGLILSNQEIKVNGLDVNAVTTIINEQKILIFAFIAVFLVFSILFAGILNSYTNKTLADVNTLEFINNAKTKEKISPKQESKLIYLLSTEENYRYSTKKKYKDIRFVLCISQAVTAALVAVMLLIALKSITHLVKFDGNTLSLVLATFVGPLAASILVLIKKRNGWISFIIIDAIAIIAACIIMLLGV
ncbi:MAG: hypothetical protein IJM36_05395 [Acholeplasmatales bacterium]|nr:hypothetical protein [Acholeplasmatales bacterium]